MIFVEEEENSVREDDAPREDVDDLIFRVPQEWRASER